MEWITTKEAAKILGITPSGVKQAVRRGVLKSVVKSRVALYNLSDVINYANNPKRKPGRPQKSSEMSENIKIFLNRFGTHIKNVCDKFKIGRLILFGSSAENFKTAKDYDLAVEKYPPSKFFDFYSDLGWPFDKEMDLIDLELYKEENHPLAKIVEKEGILIYGK